MNSTQRQELIVQWVARLQHWGLGPVAPVLLEILRPFGFIGSQAVLCGQPLLTTFMDSRSLEELMLLLDDPDALCQIERRLSEADSGLPPGSRGAA